MTENPHRNTEPHIDELFSLEGKCALITGGTGYLGSSFSRAMAEAGATVVISSSRSVELAQKAANELPSAFGQAHIGVKLNHMEEASIAEGFGAALDGAGKLDILVNNGLGGTRTPRDVWHTDFAEFAEHQHNNAGYFILARHLRDHIVERRNSDPTVTGSVVNIGSMYGQVASYPDAYEGVYSASPVAYHALKGGTIHMTRHMAVYWAVDQVRVNCLSPGPFPHDGIPAEMVNRLSKKSPMGRMGLPHELKGALLLLVSDAGSYITGQNINVDGGWLAW